MWYIFPGQDTRCGALHNDERRPQRDAREGAPEGRRYDGAPPPRHPRRLVLLLDRGAGIEARPDGRGRSVPGRASTWSIAASPTACVATRQPRRFSSVTAIVNRSAGIVCRPWNVPPRPNGSAYGSCIQPPSNPPSTPSLTPPTRSHSSPSSCAAGQASTRAPSSAAVRAPRARNRKLTRIRNSPCRLSSANSSYRSGAPPGCRMLVKPAAWSRACSASRSAMRVSTSRGSAGRCAWDQDARADGRQTARQAPEQGRHAHPSTPRDLRPSAARHTLAANGADS